ncbi:FeoB-associated Cys-rich membrane protein [Peribacillus tepidiphilus]|jgi:hypothetical protein|nr:FeoB-associated Cys-rich membrane protein [Peribacillus tepidiphilus]
MLINILIGSAVFGYAGYALWKSVAKQKKGKCAACAIQKNCTSNKC